MPKKKTAQLVDVYDIYEIQVVAHDARWEYTIRTPEAEFKSEEKRYSSPLIALDAASQRIKELIHDPSYAGRW